MHVAPIMEMRYSHPLTILIEVVYPGIKALLTDLILLTYEVVDAALQALDRNRELKVDLTPFLTHHLPPYMGTYVSSYLSISLVTKLMLSAFPKPMMILLLMLACLTIYVLVAIAIFLFSLIIGVVVTISTFVLIWTQYSAMKDMPKPMYKKPPGC